MKVIVQNNILSREVYFFNLEIRPFTAILTRCEEQVRQSKRHKWETDLIWDTYDDRITKTPEPVIPQQVIEIVKQKLIEMIQVQTFSEYKGGLR